VSLVNVRALPDDVRALTAADSFDWFPAASTARTENVYAVSAFRPVTVAVVPVTVVETVLPLSTS